MGKLLTGFNLAQMLFPPSLLEIDINNPCIIYVYSWSTVELLRSQNVL